MSFSHLTSAKVNVGLVQELAQNELVELLEKCDGPKVNNIYFQYKSSHYFTIKFYINHSGSSLG